MNHRLRLGVGAVPLAVVLSLAYGCMRTDPRFMPGSEGEAETDTAESDDNKTAASDESSPSTDGPSPDDGAADGEADADGASTSEDNCGSRCGGSCPPCEDGERCDNNVDCRSDNCDAGRCVTPTCRDDRQNGDETDVDCGGNCPLACTTGQTCKRASDCADRVCEDDRCPEAACDDGVRNGSESDVDCGGTCPEACTAGGACNDDDDCTSLNCQRGRCQAARCDDGVKNGDESDVDCGGDGMCPRCLPDKQCELDDDCLARVCGDGQCGQVGCLDHSECQQLNGPCTQGVCDPTDFVCQAEAIREGLNCETGIACQDGATCQTGVCEGALPRDCSHLDDACHVGSCDVANDQCVQTSLVLYKEDFSDAPLGEDVGWAFDGSAGWQIAPLGPSVACDIGATANDDHSSSDDRMGLAHTQAGCVTAATHEYSCAYSPELDTRPGDASLHLGYWRQLSTGPMASGDHHLVLLAKHDSAGWNWAINGFEETVVDGDWVYIQHDLSAYRMEFFHFGFCIARSNAGRSIGGWHLDDVVIAPKACVDALQR